MNDTGIKGTQSQATQNKPFALRLSRKSADVILPEVRESMLDDLREKPCADSLTRRYRLSFPQVVLSALWVLACKVDRLERIRAKQLNAPRDGFGTPKLEAVQRKPVAKETSEAPMVMRAGGAA